MVQCKVWPALFVRCLYSTSVVGFVSSLHAASVVRFACYVFILNKCCQVCLLELDVYIFLNVSRDWFC